MLSVNTSVLQSPKYFTHSITIGITVTNQLHHVKYVRHICLEIELALAFIAILYKIQVMKLKVNAHATCLVGVGLGLPIQSPRFVFMDGSDL